MKFRSHLLLFGASVGLIVAGQVLFGSNPVFSPYTGGRPVPDIPQKGPIVLELFTSQSCVTCPPADFLLEDLAKRPNVIALSCHVTYWNHLSWEDTLSREFCTERQNEYSRTRGSQSRFTPEMVINGHTSVIGSKSYAIGAALEKYNGALTAIDIIPHADSYEIRVPFQTRIGADTVTAQIIYFGPDQTVSMRHGENSGLQVTYTNPVSLISPLILKNDPSQSQTLSARLQKETIPDGQKGFAVLVQEKTAPYGAFLAAGQYLFPAFSPAKSP